jgi:hypothetical protein
MNIFLALSGMLQADGRGAAYRRPVFLQPFLAKAPEGILVEQKYARKGLIARRRKELRIAGHLFQLSRHMEAEMI